MGNYYMAGDNYGRSGNYAYQAGGIFGSIGKVLGGIAKTAVGILPGPVGTIARTITSAFAKPRPAAPTFTSTPAVIGRQVGLGVPPLPGFQFPTSLGPPLPQDISQPVGTMTPQGFFPGCQLKGTRPNKSSYYRAVPGSPGTAVLIPKGSVCVKSRRMNVANPRALRRSIRRAQGFAKLARRVMTFVSARAPKGRAKFKSKR